MRKNEAQLSLIELPSRSSMSSSRKPPKMAPALIAKHCNELLAELERVTSGRAPREHSRASAYSREDVRAVQLAQLFTAVEGAHAASLSGGSSGGSSERDARKLGSGSENARSVA